MGSNYCSFIKPLPLGRGSWYVLSKKRFKKDILYQKGYNDEINEIDFCDKNDIYRIYDCGLLKYVWKNNKI